MFAQLLCKFFVVDIEIHAVFKLDFTGYNDAIRINLFDDIVDDSLGDMAQLYRRFIIRFMANFFDSFFLDFLYLSRMKMAYLEECPEPSHRLYGWIA